MEKSLYKPGSLKRILITGPESTGKTELAASLALNFGGKMIPEYARDYIEHLTRPYEYSDVEHIARHQERSFLTSDDEQGWIFFDTWLFITKVWFDVRYDKIPGWIDESLSRAEFDLILLCETDIPWVDDPVRENGGEMRKKLFNLYKYEIEKSGTDWAPVTGTGIERVNRAIQLINNHIINGTT